MGSCVYCYGTGQMWNDRKEQMVECPKCTETSTAPLQTGGTTLHTKDAPTMVCPRCEDKGVIFTRSLDGHEIVKTCTCVQTKEAIQSARKEDGCTICNDTGKYYNENIERYEPCPNCNEIAKLLAVSPLEAFHLIGKELKIPEEYVGADYVTSLDTLGYVGSEKYNAQKINEFLSELYLTLSNKKVYKESVLLSLIPHLDIDYIAYSTMQLAMVNGYSTVPYISINELYNLQGVYTTEPKPTQNSRGIDTKTQTDYRVMDGLRLIDEMNKTYHDYTHCDICFIKISANPTAEAVFALADLVQVRASKGLATFVMSYTQPKFYRVGGIQNLIQDERNKELSKTRKLRNISMYA